MRVLIVDDEPVSRMVMKQVLESLGHQVLAAEGGERGWELFQADQPDIVISDWMMPDVDGLELCRRIRHHREGVYASFILITSLDDKEHALKGMIAGADDYLTKPLDVDELKMRLVAADRLNKVHRRLAEQQTRLEQLNLELHHLARIDALTGLGNRLRLNEDLSALEAQAARYESGFCIGLLDLDRFKDYNDEYGHLKGDRALVAVADAITSQVRSADNCYRFGGEEFVCVFARQSLSTAAQALDRIRASVIDLGIPHSRNLPLRVMTISAGASREAPAQHHSTETLLQRADEALYLAKQNGRNRVETCGPDGPDRAANGRESGLVSVEWGPPSAF
jgi:two-component system cell cycle response regulator